MQNKNFIVKTHIAGSATTLVFGVGFVVVCLVPSFIPEVHRVLVEDRMGIVLPYVLFIALGGSIFSIWHFLFHKK